MFWSIAIVEVAFRYLCWNITLLFEWLFWIFHKKISFWCIMKGILMVKVGWLQFDELIRIEKWIENSFLPYLSKFHIPAFVYLCRNAYIYGTSEILSSDFLSKLNSSAIVYIASNFQITSIFHLLELDWKLKNIAILIEW